MNARTLLPQGPLLLALSVVAACGGDSSPTTPNTPPSPPPTPSIALALAADSVRVFKGDSVAVPVTVTRSGGFTGSITLSVTGVPSGVTATTDQVGSGTTGLVRFSAAGSAGTSLSNLSIEASGAGVTSVSRPLRLSVEDFVLGLFQVGTEFLGAQSGDQMGRAVDISDDGTRVVVAATNYSGPASAGGLVRVYRWVGGSWSRIGPDIVGRPSQAGQASIFRIGDENTVAIAGDGSRLVVGAPKADPSGFPFPTSAVLYDLTATSWAQVSQTFIGAGSVGKSVAISTNGERFGLGITSSASLSGGVSSMFEFAGSGWAQMAPGWLTLGRSGEEHGHASDLSGDGTRFVVSTRNNDGAAQDAGSVVVWDWNGTAWFWAGEILGDPITGGRFGQSVSISRDGRRIAVSASPGHYARVFERNGTAWTPMGARFEVVHSAESQNLSLSEDGSRLALGFPDEGNGVLRVYEWDGSAWNQLFEDVTAPPGQTRFGQSVSLSADGRRVVVGSPGSGAGSARVYEIPDQL